ncbi:hypothetical protein KFE25_013133 [Diacronema lutheri]|uniref:Uncharacterized protein n=2 Tax=Diacronema lutheri TaxID=2081491 RepID=A0A8J5XBG2_DIALT|nr:hypothetical protein KFE25_013133 [Diacronema lutheri]
MAAAALREAMCVVLLALPSHAFVLRAPAAQLWQPTRCAPPAHAYRRCRASADDAGRGRDGPGEDRARDALTPSGSPPSGPTSLAAYLLPYAAGVLVALMLASAAFYAVVTGG